MENLRSKEEAVARIKKTMADMTIDPEEINDFLTARNSSSLTQKQKLSQVILRPGIGLHDLMDAVPKIASAFENEKHDHLEQAEIQVKYEVYIGKGKELVTRMSHMEELEIPNAFEYAKVQAISNEAREKLKKIKPRTLGQASRISGINPSDVQILMVYMGR
jgi:tRNA uridine 5-carboxymethylaminomethyl modification enzyme